MASEGPSGGGTAANDATVGTIDWTNPTEILSDDASNSYIAESNTGQTKYIKVTNFSFSIPTGATINGIKVTFTKSKYGTVTANDEEVKIVKSNGSIGTENKALAGEWTDASVEYDYGNSTDLWNESWESSDINNSNFGVVLSANVALGSGEYARLKYVKLTVTYTEATEGGQDGPYVY